ncbi:GCN5-related N-acetyltransferase [Rhizoctonia solani AG-3 Rhs1AP]|uniref:GCN5-related N-acetyltransferase n=2 Tax=Rhizoctonia solani AG-3 TaxID=1086053 RepID=A0A074RPF4_9AGAM|nr:GCN5-related N-acetyltransferase [Rhizoctonia solani AG-3 Rhs1AP]KEP48951.1 GCN5-related N-acetyltransferase [Rhizoctonia solani 123E]
MDLFPLFIHTPLPDATTYRIEQVPWDDVAGQTLRDEQVAELSARFGMGPENAPGIPPLADNISLFLLAYPYTSNHPVACGAVRHLEDGFMEIKRMYSVPTSRGTGVALCVLLALEQYARELGVQGLKLETSTLQPDAIRFYQKHGYEEIPQFGYYVGVPWSRCFQKRLNDESRV